MTSFSPSLERIRELLARMDGTPVLVLGDLMLDAYLSGKVERISPEGPVPVVAVNSRSARLGGAGNVALNVRALGGEARLVGICGDDDAGRELKRLLSEAGISTDGLVADEDRPTSVKTRVLGGGQQVCRYDVERIGEASGASLAALRERVRELLVGAGAVILSDYGKGVMVDSLVTEVVEEAGRLGIPVVVDPKEGHFSAYKGVDLVTPNKSEAAASFGMPIRDERDLETVGRGLLERLQVKAMMITLGEDGIALFAADESVQRFPARARQVFDVTGAGDTVVTTLALCLAAGASLAEAAVMANHAAGIVVAKIGTAAVEPHALLAACMDEILGEPVSTGDGQILAKEDAAAWAQAVRESGKRIVFTNGCYDILHFGHLALLNAAAKRGDKLVVGINSDASVSRLKGPARPVNPLEERARLLAHLRSVDLVVPFDEDTPLALIEAIRPDVLVKGDEYDEDAIVGAAELRAWGGEVFRFPMQQGYSTTLLLEEERKAAVAQEHDSREDGDGASLPRNPQDKKSQQRSGS